MTGHELLARLAPPPSLVDWLETVFAAKRTKGEAIPAEYERWLRTWADIRSDGASVIDGVPAETWEQVGLIIVKNAKELAF